MEPQMNADTILTDELARTENNSGHVIGWILKSIEEESQKVSKKNILGFSGILKGKQDALKFEREIRNEWGQDLFE